MLKTNILSVKFARLDIYGWSDNRLIAGGIIGPTTIARITNVIIIIRMLESKH